MDFWKRPKFIAWTLCLILLTVVILQNSEPTRIRFLFWSFFFVPKLALILISMAVGAVMALLAGWEIRSRRNNRKRLEAPSAVGPPASPPAVN